MRCADRPIMWSAAVSRALPSLLARGRRPSIVGTEPLPRTVVEGVSMSAVVARIDVDLEDVECTVKITRPLVGVPGSVVWTELPSGVAKVSADATLYIFDDDDDKEPERRVIARASAYTVDLDRVGDVVDVFDQVGGEAFEIAESILGDDEHLRVARRPRSARR